MTTAPGAKRGSATSSQWPEPPVPRSRISLPPTELIATSMWPSLSKSAAATPRPFTRGSSASPTSEVALAKPPGTFSSTCTGPASLARWVTGIAPFASTRSRFPSLFRSTQMSPQPVKFVPKAAANAGCPFTNESPLLRKTACPCPRELRDEQIGPPVAVEVALGDPHARVRVGEAHAAGAIDEAEAEAPRRRDVDVVAVRVLVVCDVEVEPPVAVQVGEDRAERVVVRRRVECRPACRPRGSGRGRSGRCPRSGRAGRAPRGGSSDTRPKSRESARSPPCSRRRRGRGARRRSRRRPRRRSASRRRRRRRSGRPR